MENNFPNDPQRIQPHYVVASQPTNTMGTVGFVLSIAAYFVGWTPFFGWFLGPFVWLMGFLFSLVGVFKKPRGLAVAGLIISFLGFFLLFIVLGLIFGVAAFSLWQ